MKRVYTDERFPGAEVHNYGDTQFFEVQNGKAVNRFFACESESPEVSDEFAQRRAAAHFERMDAHRQPAQESVVESKLPANVVESDSVPVQIVRHLLDD